MRSAAINFGIVLLVIGVMQLVIAADRLPERVATHFDMHGHADGWSSRAGYLWFQGLLLAGVAGLFGLLWWGLPRIPLALLNVPNKDYWFAPERSDESWRYLRNWLVWMADLTLVFFLLLFEATLQVNLDGNEGGLGVLFWIALIGYLVGTAVLVVMLYRRFRAP